MIDATNTAYTRSLINSGKYQEAESSLLATINAEPVTVDVVLMLARVYFMQLRIQDAVDLLQKHPNLRPCIDTLREYFVGERLNREAMQLIQNTVKSGSTSNLLDQAVMMHLTGDIPSAMKLCRHVINLEPQNALAYNHLGRALFNAKMADDALAAFEQAIKLDSTNYQAWHNLGHVLRSKNNILIAENAYQKSITIAPYYQSALLNLALLWMNQGKNSQAITLLDKIISINKNNSEALLNLGICHQILRNFDHAKTALERAASIEPVEPRTLRHLGNLYKELQDSTRAIACFRKALEINPNDSDLVSELVSTLELLNSLEEAQEIIDDALIRMPDDANILFESAKISRRRGDYENAIVTLQNVKVQQLHPRLLQSFYYERATVYDRLGKFSEAFVDFKQGNDLASTSIRAHNTNKSALKRQMDAVKEWLVRGAQASASEADEDLGNDLCFLIGFPRSGTTLLDVMLDGHTNVLSLEEKPTIEHIAYMLDQMLGHYPDAMAALSREERHMLRSKYRESIASYRKPEHTLVIDKMPIRTIHTSFMHRLFPEAKFLFAERH
ncbi:MAG TPA: tetratricopeptide repeat protein, partial [Arenimonas sp.]|nr:tetratricopeptide repeat protein [Arenimonas sp.]